MILRECQIRNSLPYYCFAYLLCPFILLCIFIPKIPKILSIISIRSHSRKWPWRDWQPLIALVARSYRFVYVRGTCAWSPTGLIPWFSKTEGNTYATLLHHPLLFREIQRSAQEVARRIFGTVAGEAHASKSTKPSTHRNPYLSHYIICHLPLVFLSPTSPLPFYSPSLSQSPPLFLLAFFCLLVCPFVLMVSPKGPDHLLRRMEEIESNIRSFMNLQFEHNNFFRKELKEQKGFLSFMNK